MLRRISFKNKINFICYLEDDSKNDSFLIYTSKSFLFKFKVEENIMPIAYRFATIEDLPEIHEFAVAALKDADMLPNFAASMGVDMLERIDLYPGNVLLAEDNKDGHRSIIGFIEIDATRIKESAFFIRGIYVLPEYRRQGIGRKLINTILEKKCTKGQQLRVESFGESETKFWESLGFKVHHVSLYTTPGKK